jgi:hypothetical protein
MGAGRPLKQSNISCQAHGHAVAGYTPQQVGQGMWIKCMVFQSLNASVRDGHLCFLATSRHLVMSHLSPNIDALLHVMTVRR